MAQDIPFDMACRADLVNTPTGIYLPPTKSINPHDHWQVKVSINQQESDFVGYISLNSTVHTSITCMIDYNWDIFQGLTGRAGGGWLARDAPGHGKAGERLQRITRKQSSRKLPKLKNMHQRKASVKNKKRVHYI